jgi:dihydroxyacetone kinase-like protein
VKKLINAPEEVLVDALAGVAAAHPSLTVNIEERYITRAGGPTPGKDADAVGHRHSCHARRATGR